MSIACATAEAIVTCPDRSVPPSAATAAAQQCGTSGSGGTGAGYCSLRQRSVRGVALRSRSAAARAAPLSGSRDLADEFDSGGRELTVAPRRSSPVRHRR